MNLGKLFLTFLLIIVALALTPTVQEQVTNVTGTGGNNLTGSALALAQLIPLFWVIIVLSVGVAEPAPGLAGRCGTVYVQFKGMKG